MFDETTPLETLLNHLGVIVSGVDGDNTILILSEIPETPISVATSNVRNWCIRRIESQKKHKHKSISRQGGTGHKSAIIKGVL